ncbi:MAG: MotA/TolQ/ExbB proton channel family protein [Bdellovibrionales bacterium]|nr:MotA/TolQ/ExbB proton channel family protein [Bdellovibrionales bacterium]
MLTDQLLALSSAAHEVVLWFLIILSIFSIAIIMDRFFLLKNFLSETSLILSEMIDALESNRNSHMKLVYDKYALLPAGKLLQKGWEHITEKRDRGLEEMMNSHLLALKPKMEKRLGFLATLGSNAPFIGLLGTIFGVMEAFEALGSDSGSAAVVMVGISKALVATAVGLIVAIPAITAYNFLQKQLKMIFHHLESMKETLLSFAKNCHK